MTPDPAEFNLDDLDRPKANAFIQWKGTDVCMDFCCDCGATGHCDGYFHYVVECPKCGQKWEMPMILFPRKSERDPTHGGIQMLQLDDDL